MGTYRAQNVGFGASPSHMGPQTTWGPFKKSVRKLVATPLLLWKFVRCFYQWTRYVVLSKSAALSLKYVLIVYIWTEIGVKVKLKIRSNKGHQNKIMLSVMRHMFYESFGTQNSMVTFIVKFGPRKWQCQAKQGPIGQILIFIFFLQKHAHSGHFCLRIPKTCFYARQWKPHPAAGRFWPPRGIFPIAKKTAADIDTKHSVPFSATIWRFPSKFQKIRR